MRSSLSTPILGAKLLLLLAHLVVAPPPMPHMHRLLPGTTGGTGGTTDTTDATDTGDVGPVLDVIDSATNTEVSSMRSMRNNVKLAVDDSESTLDSSISGQESYLSGRLLTLSEATSCNSTNPNNASSGILPVKGIEVSGTLPDEAAAPYLAVFG